MLNQVIRHMLLTKKISELSGGVPLSVRGNIRIDLHVLRANFFLNFQAQLRRTELRKNTMAAYVNDNDGECSQGRIILS